MDPVAMDSVTPLSSVADTAKAPDALNTLETGPIALIEALDSHGRVQARHRLSGVDAHCVIGRDLRCDLVLDDAFVAAQHTKLILQADGRVIAIDLGSTNPTRSTTSKGSKTFGAYVSNLLSSEILILGNTRLRIRTQLEAPSKELPLKYSALLQHRTTLAIAGIIVVCLLNTYQSWLKAPDKLFNDVLSSSLGFGVITAIWVSLWALVNRVVYGKWNNRVHLAIACMGIAASMLSGRLFEPISYALQWNWMSGFGTAISIACLLIALYLHLRVATELTVRTAALVALLLPGLIGGTSKWLDIEKNQRDVSRVDIEHSVYSPSLLWTRGESVDTYLSRITDLRSEAQHKRARSLKDSPINGSNDDEE